MKYFIITGASRGIGAALAKRLTGENHHLICVSRSRSDELAAFAGSNKVDQLTYDLCELDGIESLVENMLHRVNESIADSICFINNAAMLSPLKPIDQCTSEEIVKHMNTNLLAPLLLISHFLRLTNHWKVERTVMNISSGSAQYPSAGMSCYCTAKAGLNMLTQCIGKEQETRENPVRIIAVGPGMVETDMQVLARNTSKVDLPMADYFIESKEDGRLYTAEEAAQKLLQILFDPEVKTGGIAHI